MSRLLFRGSSSTSPGSPSRALTMTAVTSGPRLSIPEPAAAARIHVNPVLELKVRRVRARRKVTGPSLWKTGWIRSSAFPSHFGELWVLVLALIDCASFLAKCALEDCIMIFVFHVKGFLFLGKLGMFYVLQSVSTLLLFSSISKLPFCLWFTGSVLWLVKCFHVLLVINDARLVPQSMFPSSLTGKMVWKIFRAPVW